MWWSTKTSGGLHYGGVTVEECQNMIQKSLQTPKMKFLMAEMEKSGCHVSSNFIKAVRCNGKGTLVCSNFMRFQDEVNQVVIHELIHAYDECRAVNLNWRNCIHHACSEIRAKNLSGDCHYMRELLRGFTNLRGHQPVSSLSNNMDCEAKGDEIGSCKYMSKMTMKAAWDICYNDTKPSASPEI